MTARWRVLALMTTAQAGASVVQQALGSLSPILIASFALSKAQLGVLFTALMGGSACFTAIAGVMTDRWGERRMVLFSGVAMTIALLAVTLVPSYPWVVAWIFVFGAGYAASTPAGGRAILAWFERDRGFAMGIRQTGVPVGGLLGALTLPLIAHVAGYRGAFVFAAAVVAASTLVAVLLYREAPDSRAGSASFASVARGMRTLARDPRLTGVTLTCMVRAGRVRRPGRPRVAPRRLGRGRGCGAGRGRSGAVAARASGGRCGAQVRNLPGLNRGRSICAQVAELVDALVSGISGRKVVGVRVPSWAPQR